MMGALGGLEGGKSHGEKWPTSDGAVSDLTSTSSKHIKTHRPVGYFQEYEMSSLTSLLMQMLK